MSQDQLIEGIKRKDREALGEFVATYKDRIFHTCLGYVQNNADAEDLTQEVFIKLLERIDQFKGQSLFSSWIIRIAINLSLNFLRDNKKRLNQIDLADVDIEEEEFSTEEKKQIKVMLRKAIYSLPERQRKVFILSKYLDMKYTEIADITGYSISTIESLLFRSRKNLREKLGDFYKNLNS